MTDHIDQKKRKRRIMHAFRIDEISAVDRPAQQGARMTLMKRAEREEPMPPTEVIYTRSQPIDIGPAAEVVVRKTDPLPPREPTSFEEAVNAIHKRDGGARCDAMSKAACEFPGLLAKYQADGLKLADEARPAPIRKVDAAIHWNNLVAAIRAREGCSNVEAMRRAADQHPAELKAYREA